MGHSAVTAGEKRHRSSHGSVVVTVTSEWLKGWLAGHAAIYARPIMNGVLAFVAASCKSRARARGFLTI